MSRQLAICTLALLVPASAAAQTTVKPPFVLVKGKLAKAGKAPVGEPPQATELIESGLKWLSTKQDPDGRWTRAASGKHDDDNDVIPTALALMAFAGHGHTHRYGMFKRKVSKAARWLKTKCRVDGGVWGAKSEAPVLTQAWACMALAELYFVTRDPFLKRYAQQGLKHLLTLEHKGGGFGFATKGGPNTLATAVVVLSLKSAKLAQLPIPPKLFERCRAYFKTCTGSDGLVGFSKPKQGISLGVVSAEKGKAKTQPARVPLFTAGAVIGRIFTGERRSTPQLTQGLALLTVSHPEQYEPLYAYLGAYAKFQQGGPAWKRWSVGLRETLGARRLGRGHWAAAGVMGKLGGEVGTTGVSLLGIEILARYERSKD